MDVYEAIISRRSVRKYKRTEVERDKLEAVLRAGAYAPSALNDQSRQLVAITDKKLLGELNEAVKSLLSEDTVKRIVSRSESGSFDFFYRAPVLIAVCAPDSAFRPAEDCACALENMFLAARGLGLGTCWINQLVGNSDAPAVRAVLDRAGVKPECKVYGCCALGYADGEPALSRPKTNEIIIK